MENWQVVLAILAMFLLRLGVPLAITVLVTYWLRRLDSRWQAEARMRPRLSVEPVTETIEEAALRAVDRPSPMRILPEPCWEFRGCSQSQRMQCPAYQRREQPCWKMRYQTEGRLPSPCVACPIFTLGNQTPSGVLA